MDEQDLAGLRNDQQSLSAAVRLLRAGEAVKVACDVADELAELLKFFEIGGARVRGHREAVAVAKKVLAGCEGESSASCAVTP